VESRLVVTISGRGAQTGARDVNTAIDSVRRNARDLTQQLDSSFGRLKQSLFSVQGAIAGIGIGDFVRRSIQSFVEFERGLANVGKTTDIAGQELQDLGKQIIEMSKSIPVARNELLNIAASAGQLGTPISANSPKSLPGWVLPVTFPARKRQPSLPALLTLRANLLIPSISWHRASCI